MRPTTMRTYPATRTPHASKAAVCAWCGIEISRQYKGTSPTCRDCFKTERNFGRKDGAA